MAIDYQYRGFGLLQVRPGGVARIEIRVGSSLPVRAFEDEASARAYVDSIHNRPAGFPVVAESYSGFTLVDSNASWTVELDGTKLADVVDEAAGMAWIDAVRDEG